jgi:hypothetical protein
VLYLSGTGWVIDAPTDYPLKQGTARPQYNALSGGVWSTADVANNKYATSWILATNNLTYPVIAIIGQAESDLQSAAEAVDFTSLQLPGFPSVEFRPLYRLVFQCADSFSNAVKASLVSITDIRSIAAAGVAASLITDHGNLSGLSDDDHPQYLSVDTVRASLTAAVKASFLPSQAGNAGKFLTTDATSTSWAALTSGNITTALGFTPYNATNPAGYITGITSSDVTTALGFTPYNATNPSGYVTAAGARGAISVTGAGSYDSATGVINIVGGVTSFNTRTGAITLSSADVTTALGFTPYNSTNPSGYITGITSGMVTTALGFTPYNATNPAGYISSYTETSTLANVTGRGNTTTTRIGVSTSSPLDFAASGNTGTWLGGIQDSTTGWSLSNAVIGIKSDDTTYAAIGLGTGNGLLYFGRTTASGVGTMNSWLEVNSSGVANFKLARPQHNGSNLALVGELSGYLPLSGGTLTGTLGSARNDNQRILESYNTSAGSPTQFFIEHSLGSVNVGNARGNINISSGSLLHGGNQVLHAGNYGSYALPLAGGNATGPIRVTASGGFTTDTDANGNVNFVARLQSDSTFLAAINQWGYQAFALNVLGTSNSSTSRGYIEFYTKTDGNWRAALRLNNGVPQDGSGNILLHAGNYNSYALPITGGTISGLVRINNQLRVGQNTNGTAYIDAYDGYAWFGRDSNSTGIRIDASGNVNVTGALTQGGNQVLHAGNVSSYAHTISTNPSNPGPGTLAIGNNGSYSFVQSHSGQALNLNPVGNAVNIAGNTAIHAGNYSSYALPIGGGTLTGNLTMSGPGASTSIIFGDVTKRINVEGYWMMFKGHENEGFRWQTAGQDGATYTTRMQLTSSALTVNGNTVLHASNVSSFALPIGGGSLSGNLSITPVSSSWAEGIAFQMPSTSTWGGLRWRRNRANDDGNWGIGFTALDSSDDLVFVANNGGAQINNILRMTKAGVVTNNGNQILHAGNYTSYSPSLGGSGASGTWGISITGNSATANKTNANSGYARVGYGMAPFYNWGGSNAGAGAPSDSTYTTGIDVGSNPGDQAYGFQIASNMWNVGLWTRTYNSGFSGWVRILDSSNYTSYSPSLTGSGASGTWGINITGSANTANSASNSNTVGGLAPAQFFNNMGNGHTTYTDFNSVPGFGNYFVQGSTNSPTGIAGNQFYGFTLGLGNEYAYSLYASQIYYPRRAQNGETYIYVRDREGGSWTSWTKIRAGYSDSAGSISGFNNPTTAATANTIAYRTPEGDLTVRELIMNVSVQDFTPSSLVAIYPTTNQAVKVTAGGARNFLDVPTRGGGNASGSWGISITGTARGLDSSHYLARSGSSGNINTDFGNTPAGTMRHAGDDANISNSPGGSWWFYDHYRHSNGSNLWGTTVAWGWEDNSLRLAQRNVSGGGFSGWTYYINSNNYTSYSLNRGGDTVSGVFNFQTNKGGRLSSTDTASLQVYSTGNNSAFMSFHKGGHYAVNFGLDDDNVMRIGGWSAAANRYQFDMSGNFTAAGNVTAYSDERLKKDWGVLPTDFIERLAKIKSGTYTRIDSEERQAGVSAQDFQTLLPETVSTDAAGMLSVNYGGAALASAVELAKRVVDQEKRIAHLESLINKLIGD